MGVATQSAAPAAPAAEGPPTGRVAFLLSQAGHVLQTRLTAALEDLFVTPRSWCLLSTAMTGDYTQSELAQAVGLDKTTMVVTMDELEAAGLARRVPSATDRRVRVIAVTPEGEAKVAEAQKVVDRVHEEVLAELPPHDREVFVASLERLAAGPLAAPAECSKPPRRRAPR